METDPAEDPMQVLVVVLNHPVELARVSTEGWYRIPLARAPVRIAAEYLAFYQTGAFPPEERWSIRWLAEVRGYRIASRRELIPEEPEHPRAGDQYYRVELGSLEALIPPVPSRRLRRITFIQTTLARLRQASEINDLWIKSTAQERLWAALRSEGLEVERQYVLREDLPHYVIDFALFGPLGPTALIVTDEPRGTGALRELEPPDYLLAAGGWRVFRVTCADLESDPAAWLARIASAQAR